MALLNFSNLRYFLSEGCIHDGLPIKSKWQKMRVYLFCSKNYAQGLYRKEAQKGGKKLCQTMLPPKGTKGLKDTQRAKNPNNPIRFRIVLHVYTL